MLGVEDVDVVDADIEVDIDRVKSKITVSHTRPSPN